MRNTIKQMAGDLRAIRRALEAEVAMRAVRRGLEETDERAEFAQILAGLKRRGVITQDDIERLERDGAKEVRHG